MEASCQSKRDSTIINTKRAGARPEARGGGGSGMDSGAPVKLKARRTHHSDGEVVVDDLVGHGVALLLVRVRHHLHAPAVHEHWGAALQLLQHPAQVHAVVPWGGAHRTGGEGGGPTHTPIKH